MQFKTLLTLLMGSFIARGQQQADFDALPHNNPLKTPLDSAVHQSAKDFFRKANAPGAILSVYRKGELYTYCYGYADNKERKIFSDTTLLEIGSVTKTFTAGILLRLQQEGRLDLDQSLAAFFPEAAAKNERLQQITLRQLLSHTGGLPRLPDNLEKVKNYNYLQPYEGYDRDNMTDFLKTLQPAKAGKYAYSNLGYGVLGTVAEIQSGKRYGTLLEEYIFRPYGMHHSSTVAMENLPQALGYMEGQPVPYWRFGSMAGAGAIKSTAADMNRYLQACLGATADKNYSDIVRKAIQPQMQINDGLAVGMSWHIMKGKASDIYWHNGGTYGFATFAAFEPVSQTAIFAAANAFNTNSALEAFAGKILINMIENAK